LRIKSSTSSSSSAPLLLSNNNLDQSVRGDEDRQRETHPRPPTGTPTSAPVTPVRPVCLSLPASCLTGRASGRSGWRGARLSEIAAAAAVPLLRSLDQRWKKGDLFISV